MVVGDIFEGKRSVQRQQMVYAALQEHIASGVIHAVNMKTYSKDEWQQLA
jgi:acid stress-induced BolA-like protein IbaG/YrbA